MYMGRYRPKEWKNRGKVTIFFRSPLFCYSRLSKVPENNTIIKLSPKRRWKARWEEKAKPSRVYAQRAPSNSDVDFLLSQVSHLEGKWERKTRILWKNEGAKSVFFSVVSSIFRGWKRWNVKTHTKTNHNPLYYRGLRRSVWHLWQQKHKNSCTYARMRARERRWLWRFSQFLFVHSSLINWNNTSFYEKAHVILWKTIRRLMQNHTSFYEKPHVVFWKQALSWDDWVNVLFMLDICEAIAVGEWIIAKQVVWGVKIRICTCWLSLRTIIQSFLLWNQNFWCIFADRKIATSQTKSIMPCIIGGE